MLKKIVCKFFGHKYKLQSRMISQFQRLSDDPGFDYCCIDVCKRCGVKATRYEHLTDTQLKVLGGIKYSDDK